jgi:hypothetical protein
MKGQKDGIQKHVTKGSKQKKQEINNTREEEIKKR